MANKKKTEDVIGNVKLTCHVSRWAGFKPSCEKILSVQNCLNFFGPMQPCDCFEISELNIKDRELEQINEWIAKSAETPQVKEEIEVKIGDEPPLEDKPKKKRKRRKASEIPVD